MEPRFIVRRYYGDTLIEEARIAGPQDRNDAVREYLEQGGDDLALSDERADDLTPGATRWTLTERATGFPAGAVTVTQLHESEVPTCDGCPSTGRDTHACPNTAPTR